MRSLAIIMLLACVLAITLGSVSPALAAKARQDEALNVARNWVALVIRARGAWGDAPAAEVAGIQEIKRGHRVLGYFCPVTPVGYVVVSLHKELEPVKVYSETSDLDPASEVGMADLVKGSLERVMSAVEARLGRKIDDAGSEDIDGTLEVKYRDVWDKLNVDRRSFDRSLSADGTADADYVESQVLTTTSWHQGDPYNRDCPAGATCTHTIVGCVATAGAQIMAYWDWPPYGSGSPYNDTYDWVNMLDRVTAASPAAAINAVAELSHEVGVAVGMDYGCGSSSAYTYDMEGVYENQYRYSTACTKRDRPDYSAIDWFSRIKTQCNQNRCTQYRIPDHSIVCDGWQEIGSPVVRQYHMNYGWDSSHNAWYTLDALHGGSPNDEYMLENIVPVQAFDSSFSGTYALPSFPYRYFDQDSVCSSSATINSGHYLQFLPNIVARCTSTTGSAKIYGSSSSSTRLFTRGDRSRGALIYDGAIKMFNGGGITFR